LTISRELPSGRENESALTRETQALRRELQRVRTYLGAALAILGIGTLVSLGLVGFYGMRLAERLSATDNRVAKLDEDTSGRAEEMRRELVAQGAEIIAIRKSATDDLQAMQDAQRKLASVRDPGKELAALREANEALWGELATQKAELVDSLRDRRPETGLVASPTPAPRFRLGETQYVDPGSNPNAIKGFVGGDEKIHRANNQPANPALVVIELTPADVGLGDPYRLSIRLVNRSNRPLHASSLRLDWSFQGMNTGGDVPVEVSRIDAQSSALVYSVAGEWTEAHKKSPASVTATLTLDGGARLSNTLRW
jgi:hypothetical protein